MMSESSDESGELVDREEAVNAEQHASKNNMGTESTISAPAPLPAFLTSPVKTSPSDQAPVLNTTQPTTSPSNSPPRLDAPSIATSMPTVSGTVDAAQARISPDKTGEGRQPKSSPATPHTDPLPSSTTTPSSKAQISASQLNAPGSLESPHDASTLIPLVEEMDIATPTQNTGLLNWISGSSVLSKVVQKTKSSVESMITTLDPGMKEVIRSGGDICIVVTSVKDSKVGAVREAFQTVFGQATVTGKESTASTAAQPVGFTAGLKGAQERIQNLRQSSSIPDDQPVVSLEGFVVEMLPDRWYELSCLILQDTCHDIELQTFSQPCPVPAEYILKAQDQTPQQYPLRWSGWAVTIGQLVQEACPGTGHSDWQKSITGVSRRDSLQLAARSLAYMYQQRLPKSSIS